MRHLLICPELPPAAGGGIGAYAATMARLLAERGEVVHVVAQAEGYRQRVERRVQGRLVIHWIPWAPQFRLVREFLGLRFRPKPFLWRAALLAEEIIEEEEIDVVEAQEYQAPLYWFQVRRALGMGPARKPPCIVHLHSPTLLIARHNGWRPRRTLRATMRLERYSVRSADAVIAPSGELARWAESYYRLRGPVQVIPYPVEPQAATTRTAEIWSNGAVCYVGRMEERKGVLEWIDAAVEAASEFPMQRFELVGGDTRTDRGRSVRRELGRRIPRAMRSRFHFAGEQPREALAGFLARARIAAVPSRWDNYPYACIEAMRSGLPVVGTRTGGIAEMVVDGRNGWLAERASASLLYAELRKALRTPPSRLAAMGAAAADDIAQTCDPERIIQEHLEHRKAVSHRGLESSVRPPLPLLAKLATSTAGLAMHTPAPGTSAPLR